MLALPTTPSTGVYADRTKPIDCNKNSSLHNEPAGVSSFSVSTSDSRNVARAGPTVPIPTSSHGRNASASASSSSGSASNRPSGQVNAVSQASTARCRLERPRRGGSRSIGDSAARTAASTIASRAEVASSCGSCPPTSARQTGGIAETSEVIATTSRPCNTGRQQAAAPWVSRRSWGSTRPRSTNSRAKTASSAR
ncbi:Uncharacterised protein [Mycobacterium tuberculosis]|uniref:Uncharacterized protein n=1 Tax=Mycobacterium tuberculosis TaxID=1773 RepID=A0A655JFJ2_MYCTX|nr:Uncharacterised protein [Mycobacterium tuberculosis]